MLAYQSVREIGIGSRSSYLGTQVVLMAKRECAKVLECRLINKGVVQEQSV